ncbi:MAG: type II secretion system F family protein, partial [Candidatus Marinimicrobia bacterium]|nr:type II secretion system F family protein [Candidatus Neomarinimicrobiota bacterium]
MPQYKCRIVNANGDIAEDVFEASSILELKRSVIGDDECPISIKKIRLPALKINFIDKFYRVKPQDLENFTAQLVVMLKAGVPLVKSLETVLQQFESDNFKNIVLDIIEKVNQGVVFSKALSEYPKVFNPLYVNMVKVGETTGSLDVILDHIRSFLHHDIAVKRKIKSAMRYPIIVISILVLAFVAAIGFIMPRFAEMFANAGVALPLPTKALIFLSVIITKYWFITFWVVLIVMFSIRFYVQRPAGAYRFDAIKLAMPVFKDIVLQSTLARFAHILETLSRSGVKIVQALEIVEQTLGNRVIAKDVAYAREQVIQGVPIANALSESKHIPQMTIMM